MNTILIKFLRNTVRFEVNCNGRFKITKGRDTWCFQHPGNLSLGGLQLSLDNSRLPRLEEISWSGCLRSWRRVKLEFEQKNWVKDSSSWNLQTSLLLTWPFFQEWSVVRCDTAPFSYVVVPRRSMKDMFFVTHCKLFI